MYRVELKEHWAKPPKLPVPQFLMYRVELKVILDKGYYKLTDVPNVPCGVERDEEEEWFSLKRCLKVPNVPCGVESLLAPQAVRPSRLCS